jgi:hypothetical protein
MVDLLWTFALRISDFKLLRPKDCRPKEHAIYLRHDKMTKRRKLIHISFLRKDKKECKRVAKAASRSKQDTMQFNNQGEQVSYDFIDKSADEILRSKTNAHYCADMPRDYLLENVELIKHVSELSKQIEKGIDRNRREGALTLREMEKLKVKTDLTESNKQTKNKRLSQVAFEGGKKKLLKMGKKELIDQATLRSAKSHQNFVKDELLEFCLAHKKKTWTPSQSGSSVSSGNDIDSQAGYGSDTSNPPPKKYHKRK